MNVNTEHQQQPKSGALDVVVWIVIAALLVGLVAVNHFYGKDSTNLVRAVVGVAVFAAALGLATLTRKGKEALAFAKESRTEVRKVVWPTRQETVHTTLIIMAAVAIMGLLLWGMDGILVRVIGWFTGLEI
ncbi:preprotein translocase subunit SecE [Gallaecimonas xiamenensis]|uniref:Protein translocase subunit SecE n=1 Tax=Gallaecimonas xiamenensis 3-C-1 TaxID=745411 RepID=K2IBU1_9GAMM|nr:preprotein translocase subunit SecE [Gallaecimonas xiamenensis]EKE67381.1 preprotein translocase subunit SecE [Gallaecimonas xiamenensis 3-C-1]